MTKRIAVLGATGSVGRQAIDVARSRGYKVELLSANTDVKGTELLARELQPTAVAMADESAALDLRARLADTDVKVYGAAEGITDAIREGSFDTVINAIIGEAGLRPTLATIDAGHRLALANKESLVIAGDEVMRAVREKNVELIPVDSEHSAIFQSAKSGTPCEIKRIFLTASGGPFFGKTKEELRSVTLADTLAHPTWSMGKKITVDSATLMNKGFEVIEAVHLFGVRPEDIEVVIHRESILHSAVEFADRTVIGEMSVPDMRMCVQYAVDYPARYPSSSDRLDLAKLGRLTFTSPDFEDFPLLALAYETVKKGGACPAVMNAADEIAVAAFLDGKIPYHRIAEIVISTVEKMSDAKSAVGVDQIIACDRAARRFADSLLN